MTTTTRARQHLADYPPTDRLRHAIIAWLSDIACFSRTVIQRPLRPYQLEPARAILDSVLHGRGLSFAIMMSRQAGKNELSAQIEAYLLNLYQRRGGQIVKASPTFKPQTVNSIMRLADHLANPWNDGMWHRREGYIIELGHARCLFFSADPHANVVGATADLLLEADEAQDIAHTKWYKDFRPMAASTNATSVMYGTAWTSTTLLAQTIATLNLQEAKDGTRRVFTYAADQVTLHVPAYGHHVDEEVARLGRHHPLVKTQYFLETIDAQSGLFPPQRRALMHGDHERRFAPEPGHRYALLIDVAGEDEAAGDPVARAMLTNVRRDATAVTIVDVDIRPNRQPHYRVVNRQSHLGTRHSALAGQLLALARHWNALWIVVDATGVGAGLASFLAEALGDRVIPVTFSTKVKSDLGWDFLAIVETGRYADYHDDNGPDTRQFWYEVGACQYQVRDGPGNLISWGVTDAPAYDGVVAYGHDDLLISAALTAILDNLTLTATGVSATVRPADELEAIDAADW